MCRSIISPLLFNVIINVITYIYIYTQAYFSAVKSIQQGYTYNYWVFGLFTSSGILENTTFRKLDLFPSSGEGGGKHTYSVGPLRKS
jgi:hypothetical protein